MDTEKVLGEGARERGLQGGTEERVQECGYWSVGTEERVLGRKY